MTAVSHQDVRRKRQEALHKAHSRPTHSPPLVELARKKPSSSLRVIIGSRALHRRSVAHRPTVVVPVVKADDCERKVQRHTRLKVKLYEVGNV